MSGQPDEVTARRLLGLAATAVYDRRIHEIDGAETAHGDSKSHYELGCLLMQGLGGPPDEVKARRLFSLAAEQGET